MDTLNLRESVLDYIQKADERLLRLIKALAESYQEGVTEEQYQIVDKRREAHLKGDSKSFTWDQVKQNARGAVK